MLRPIPSQLLGELVTLQVCTGVDVWQKPIWQEYTVSKVHIQNTNEVRKTTDNTEVALSSLLFIDGRLSRPILDYDTLAAQSQQAGRPMRAIVYNTQGQKLGDYEVKTVDPCPDVPDVRVHHIELGLM